MRALEKLYRDELADLYDAENQILKALPKLIQAAADPQLKDALQEHRRVTENQVKRLEQIFTEEGRPAAKKCKGMAGVIAEGEEVLKEDFEGSVMDAAIIGAAQRVEHYEMAAYGTVRTFAQHLGKTEVAELLQETLDEEKEADALLTQIAEANVNEEAEEETEEPKRRRAMASSGRVKSTRGKAARSKPNQPPAARRKSRQRARSTSSR